jgi:hypothetical protein
MDWASLIPPFSWDGRRMPAAMPPAPAHEDVIAA